LLLDRKLHFGDVLARVQVLATMEMNLTGCASKPVPVVFHPTVQGHVGLTEGEIISCMNRAGHESAGQRSDTDLLVAWQSSWQWYGYFHIY